MYPNSIDSIDFIDFIDFIIYSEEDSIPLNENELSIVVHIVKKKALFNNYMFYQQQYQPNMEVMNFFAGRTQQQQHAQSLLDFISIQQSNYLQQIAKYNEVLRKYNTVLCLSFHPKLSFIESLFI